MKNKIFYPMIFLLIVIFFLIDQVAKEAVLKNLYPGEIKPLLGPLDITLIYNPKFAFGLSLVPSGLEIPLVLFLLLVLVTLFVFLKHNLWTLIAGSMIISGGLSNFYDRLTVGQIVDYITLPYWPVFNLADASVTTGTVIFFIYLLFFSDRNPFIEIKGKSFFTRKQEEDKDTEDRKAIQETKKAS